ncbi:hypothetical protein ACL02V_29500 [Bacillus mobilis]|uniref:hypothetical protein n=1 Tax=Bacillus mobilis TaxID=2026190 RepID=UPI0039A0580F
MNTFDTNDIANAITDDLKNLRTYLVNAKLVNPNTFELLDDVDVPIECTPVDGQAEPACKLPDPNELPTEIKGCYKIDLGLQNIYAIKDTLKVGVQACIYSHFGKGGTATVSGISAMKFNKTRPDTPGSQHNFGRAFDVKLQGRMMIKPDGQVNPDYDQLACAYLCAYCVEAGASKVFFSDQKVVDAVNKATGKNVCQNIDNHKNHIHMDCRVL